MTDKKHNWKRNSILRQIREMLELELDHISLKHAGATSQRSVEKLVLEYDLPVEVALCRERIYVINKN